MYAYIYAKYEINDNYSKRSAVDLLTYITEYGYCTPDIAHMANILYGHIDPTVLPVYATTQANATSHDTAKYVPDINMPTK